MFACVGYAHMSAIACRGQKEVLDPLELACKPLIVEMETELWSSGRAGSTHS